MVQGVGERERERERERRRWRKGEAKYGLGDRC